MQNSRVVTFNLANLVEDKKKELMARDSALTALEAHRLAIQAVWAKTRMSSPYTGRTREGRPT